MRRKLTVPDQRCMPLADASAQVPQFHRRDPHCRSHSNQARASPSDWISCICVMAMAGLVQVSVQLLAASQRHASFFATLARGLTRCPADPSLLANAEAPEDFAEQVVGTERAGDAVERPLAQSQLFRKEIEPPIAFLRVRRRRVEVSARFA